MSLEDVFDEFEKEEEEKPVSKETRKPPEKPKGEPAPPEQAVEEKVPIPSEEEALDWFGEPVTEEIVEEPTEEGAKELPSEEAPAEPSEEVAEPISEVEKPPAEAPAEKEDLFEPAVEEEVPAEAPPEERPIRGALAKVEASPIVIPAVSTEVMRKQMELFQSLKASLLDRKRDIASIQGKPYIKRSGWRKFALVFNLSDQILKEEKEEDGDDFEWRIWVKAWAPNGRSVVGVGACSSKERNFSHLEHDVYATAHTRAKNRALSDLIGSGEVSWEELSRSWQQ